MDRSNAVEVTRYRRNHQSNLSELRGALKPRIELTARFGFGRPIRSALRQCRERSLFKAAVFHDALDISFAPPIAASLIYPPKLHHPRTQVLRWGSHLNSIPDGRCAPQNIRACISSMRFGSTRFPGLVSPQTAT